MISFIHSNHRFSIA